MQPGACTWRAGLWLPRRSTAKVGEPLLEYRATECSLGASQSSALHDESIRHSFDIRHSDFVIFSGHLVSEIVEATVSGAILCYKAERLPPRLVKKMLRKMS